MQTLTLEHQGCKIDFPMNTVKAKQLIKVLEDCIEKEELEYEEGALEGSTASVEERLSKIEARLDANE